MAATSTVPSSFLSDIKKTVGTGFHRVVNFAVEESTWIADKFFFKVAAITFKAKELAGYPLSPMEQSAKNCGEVGKSIIGAVSIFKSLGEFERSVEKCKKEFSAPGTATSGAKAPTKMSKLRAAKNVVVDFCKIGAPVNDIIDLARRFFKVNPKVAQAWSFLGPASLVVGMADMTLTKGWDTTHRVWIIVRGTGTIDGKVEDRLTAAKKGIKNLVDLAFAISYLASGIILLGSFFAGTMLVAPGVLLGLSALSLALTIAGTLYDKLYLNPIVPKEKV